MAKEEMLDIDAKQADLKARIAAREKEKSEREAAEAKVLKVVSARANRLKPGIWYITLSTGKVLATRTKAHYDAALKLIAAKVPMPVTYKEAKDASGSYWLSEIKTA